MRLHNRVVDHSVRLGPEPDVTVTGVNGAVVAASMSVKADEALAAGKIAAEGRVEDLRNLHTGVVPPLWFRIVSRPKWTT